MGNYKKSEQLLIKVVDLFDQQNETAFERLSDMYLSNGNVKLHSVTKVWIALFGHNTPIATCC